MVAEKKPARKKNARRKAMTAKLNLRVRVTMSDTFDNAIADSNTCGLLDIFVFRDISELVQFISDNKRWIDTKFIHSHLDSGTPVAFETSVFPSDMESVSVAVMIDGPGDKAIPSKIITTIL